MGLNILGVNIQGNATSNTNLNMNQNANQATSMSATGSSGMSGTPISANMTPNQVGAALLARLSDGDSFTGEITNINQNQITIALSDQAHVTATLLNAMSYNIGDVASFTVKEHNGTQVVLQALNNDKMNHLMNDQTIARSLTNAGLSINESNASLVHEMMKQNLPIDSNTVNQYAKAFEAAPSATPEDTVLLMKMGIPVTEENVSSLHDYYRYEDGIGMQGNRIAQNIGETLSAISSENPSEAGKILQDILSGYSETIVAEEKLSDNLSEDNRYNISQLLKALDPQVKTALETSENGTTRLVLHTQDRSLNKLSNDIKNGSITAKDALAQLSEYLMSSKPDADTVSQFLGSVEFKDLTEAMVRQQMYLPPEEITKSNIQRLMTKVSQDSEKIAEKLNATKGMDLASGFSQLKSDINFMNQMNQFMNFVQIPLKMTNQNGQGDLYVYRNQKHKNTDDEELKAALHLDLEHLGPIDILVKLHHKNVSTDFKVADEGVLNFIEAHMDELSSRLEALGYHVEVKAACQARDEHYSFKTNVLEKELPPTQIKRFSFDMRA